jgi:hypothetical protein
VAATEGARTCSPGARGAPRRSGRRPPPCLRRAVGWGGRRQMTLVCWGWVGPGHLSLLGLARTQKSLRMTYGPVCTDGESFEEQLKSDRSAGKSTLASRYPLPKKYL